MAHILVIDDDPFIRDVIKQNLERAGHSVDLAMNGNQGLVMCKEKAYSLVITDLIMPEKEGIETISDLKKEYPETKIIAISGGFRLPAESYLCIAKSMGANQVLSKPFDNKTLLEMVQQVLS